MKVRHAPDDLAVAPAFEPGTQVSCRGHDRLFSGQLPDEPHSDFQTRMHQARIICSTCPVLRDCAEWSLHNKVDGMAGGYTSAERTTIAKAEGIRVRDKYESIEQMVNAYNDAMVVQLTRQSIQAPEIAQRLGITKRQVERTKQAAGIKYEWLPDLESRPAYRRGRGHTWGEQKAS